MSSTIIDDATHSIWTPVGAEVADFAMSRSPNSSPAHPILPTGPISPSGVNSTEGDRPSPIIILPQTLPGNVVLVQHADSEGLVDPYLFRLVVVDPSQMQNIQNLEYESPAASVIETLSSPQASNTKALIEFKRGRTAVYDTPIPVTVGEYVIVSGDRGQDLGLIVSILSMENAEKEISQGSVTRRAAPKEVAIRKTEQAILEKEALEVCQKLVEEHQLRMEIVDAEFQFDRKKLTFFYEVHERQDFRALVRDLYRVYRARIWMCRASGESELSPTAATAGSTA